MLDVLIANGTVVASGGVREADVGILEGRIDGVYTRGTAPAAREILESAGCLVMPGLIDTHFHCRAPARPDRETWASATQAAAAGGVTTILEMPTSNPAASTPDVIRRRRETGERECFIDFALYACGAGGDPELAASLAAEGIIGFKILAHAAPPGREPEFHNLCATDTVALYRALRAIAPTGLPCAVHAEEDALLHHLIAELRATGRQDAHAHLESRPAFVEAASVASLLVLAEEVEARLHLPHMSSGWGIRLAREAKRRGLPITVETCPHYLLCDTRDVEKVGNFAKINPPIRPPEDPPALWAAILDGTIDTVASDHGPYRPEEKAEPNIWLTPAGHPGVEVLGHAVIGEALAGRIPLTRAVEVLAEKPADIFGLAPRKGRLTAGADADVVIYDPRVRWVFRKDERFSLARDNYYLWDGRQFEGQVVRTLVRGQTVYADGRIVGRPGHGRFVRPAR